MCLPRIVIKPKKCQSNVFALNKLQAVHRILSEFITRRRVLFGIALRSENFFVLLLSLLRRQALRPGMSVVFFMAGLIRRKRLQKEKTSGIQTFNKVHDSLLSEPQREISNRRIISYFQFLHNITESYARS